MLKFRTWQQVFLFPKTSKAAVGPTQPHIQWVLGVRLFPGKKSAGIDPAPRLRMSGSVPPFPRMTFWRVYGPLPLHLRMFVFV